MPRVKPPEGKEEVDIIQPWDRQPGETEAGWAGFLAYRDLGPGRNLRKAAEKLQKAEGYHTTLSKWALANNWPERVTAFDNYMQRAAVDAVRDEITKAMPNLIRSAYLASAEILKQRRQDGAGSAGEAVKVAEYCQTWIRQADDEGILDLSANATEDEAVEEFRQWWRQRHLP